MQQQKKVEKLVEWFIRSALRHAEAVAALQEEVAALQVESLNRFSAALRQEEGGIQQLLTVLDHADPAVAGMAAVYSLREAPERCRATLVRVSQEPGLIGFRAQIALERWDSGDWPGNG